MPLSEQAKAYVAKALVEQLDRKVLSWGPDYRPDDEQIAWEERLERSIFNANADLRFRVLKGTSDSGVNPDVFREAESLNVDRQRVSRIIKAAEAGFQWDDVVGDMIQNGMKREDAERVAERMAMGISSHRILEHHKREFVQNRVETRLTIAGLIVFGLAVVVGVIYWPWLLSTIRAIGVVAKQCLAS